MMRKSIRIVRLIRRRRFRYRRLHVWRLDVVAVLVLFGTGWLLLPTIHPADRSSLALSRRGGLSIVEKPVIDRDEAILSPAMFAFTAPGGFAHGVVTAQLTKLGDEIPFILSTPIRLYSFAIPENIQATSLSCVGQTDSLKMPPIPVFPAHAESSAALVKDVRAYVSIPGIVPKGHFRSMLEAGAGKSVRISVHFGADGRADSAVLFSHALDTVDATRVERAAMRLVGPPHASAWIVLRSGD